VFSPGVLIGSLIVGGLLFLVVVFLLNWSRPSQGPVGVVTAALTIIPVPTITDTPIPVIEEDTLQPDMSQGQSTAHFEIGTFVKISGTGGAGLRLRIDSGLDSDPIYLGIEDEIFKIEDGPLESDGYIWWYLVAPFEPNRKGWAVSDYLEVVQEP
jgi:hypothetical protein